MRYLREFSVPMRTLGILLASLFGGSLLSAATIGTSSGTVLSGSYSLTQDISFGYIIYSGNSSGNSVDGAMSVGGLDSTSGVPVSYSYTLPIDLGSGPIAFAGLDSSGSVTLTENNSVAPSYIGSPWPYAESEAAIATDLRSGNSADLVSFLTSHSGDFFYAPGTTQATFVAFSKGTPIGAMSLAVLAIPESRSFVLMSVGLLAFGGALAIRSITFRMTQLSQ